jgi:hypothetical protein
MKVELVSDKSSLLPLPASKKEDPIEIIFPRQNSAVRSLNPSRLVMIDLSGSGFSFEQNGPSLEPNPLPSLAPDSIPSLEPEPGPSLDSESGPSLDPDHEAKERLARLHTSMAAEVRQMYTVAVMVEGILARYRR